MDAAWDVVFLMFNNTRTFFWFDPTVTSCSDLVRFIWVGWQWILIFSLYQCWPGTKDMDLNSIKVQRGLLFIPAFITDFTCSLICVWVWEIALIQIEIFRCLLMWLAVFLPVCFSIPSHGAGTWSICSPRVMTALNSLFRATSAGSWQQATGGVTAGPRSRHRRLTQWRGEATNPNFFF